MLKRLSLSVVAWSIALLAPVVAQAVADSMFAGNTVREQERVVGSYLRLARLTWKDTHRAGVRLQQAVDALLAAPSGEQLETARLEWRRLRKHYALAAPFQLRRYGDHTHAVLSRIEARLSPWPVEGRTLDYVAGWPEAGIIHNLDVPLTRNALLAPDKDSRLPDVLTGLHVIEWLLWGEDRDLDGPGSRPASDFSTLSSRHLRRSQLLRLTTALLVEDLEQLRHAWGRGDNAVITRAWQNRPPAHNIHRMLMGLSTLAEKEIAGHWLGSILDTRNQQDAPSAFSDHTHRELHVMLRGIRETYYGRSTRIEGWNLDSLLRREMPAIATRIRKRLDAAGTALKAIPAPIDTRVIETPPDSRGRSAVQNAVTAMHALAEAFREAAETVRPTARTDRVYLKLS